MAGALVVNATDFFDGLPTRSDDKWHFVCSDSDGRDPVPGGDTKYSTIQGLVSLLVNSASLAQSLLLDSHMLRTESVQGRFNFVGSRNESGSDVDASGIHARF